MKFQLERVPRSPASDQEILSDIRRVADLVASSAISFRAYSKLGTYHPTTASLRFGTWNKATVAAGLEIGSERDIADERLFENLMCLWEHYGRQPRVRELTRPPSKISYGPYERRFHSWTNALEQFVFKWRPAADPDRSRCNSPAGSHCFPKNTLPSPETGQFHMPCVWGNASPEAWAFAACRSHQGVERWR
jgi:hypothetical protein